MRALDCGFKNALLYHSREYYHRDYEVKGHKYEYANIRLDQLPMTYHAVPLLKKFSDRNQKDSKGFKGKY